MLELDGIEPTDTAIDRLAFGRPASGYRCCHLVEFATHSWAEALVRHWVYDKFESMRWRLVADSSLPGLASIARKAHREEEFHLRHADALLDKLLASPEARGRILAALGTVAPLRRRLSEAVEGEAQAIREGVCNGSTPELAGPLRSAIAARFTPTAATTAVRGPGRARGPSPEPAKQPERTSMAALDDHRTSNR